MKNTVKLMFRKALLVSLTSVAICTLGYAEEINSAKEKPMTIKDFFQKLDSAHMDLVDQFYAPDAVFEDPIGSHKGVADIKKYYKNLYDNVDAISFDIPTVVVDGDKQVAVWVMHLKTKSLNSGKEIVTHGNSYIVFKDGKAIYHRDYFDMGEFVYENVPVLSSIIKFIKKKMKGE